MTGICPCGEQSGLDGPCKSELILGKGTAHDQIWNVCGKGAGSLTRRPKVRDERSDAF